MAASVKLNTSVAKQIVSRTEIYFFDCDGVLWNSFGLIPGALETVNKIKEMGKKIFFVTNNSSKSREDVVQKFEQNGFNVSPGEILTTSFLAATYFKNILKFEKKIYVIGSPGMKAEFDKAGLQYTGFGVNLKMIFACSLLANMAKKIGEISFDQVADLQLPQLPRNDPSKSFHLNYTNDKDPEVGAVCVGFDEYFNLNKIAQAMRYLQDESTPFIATNTDYSFPVGGGVFTPGTGCIVKAVAYAAQREPVILGKPNKLLFDIAKTVCDINPETTLMIGDRLDTDIQFGQNCGFHTLCVLTGITDQKMLENTDSVPEYYGNSIADLLEGFSV